MPVAMSDRARAVYAYGHHNVRLCSLPLDGTCPLLRRTHGNSRA